MKFKSKTEAYTFAIMELIRLKNKNKEDLALVAKADLAIGKIKTAIENHEQNPEKVIDILQEMANIKQIEGLIADIRQADFKQSPQEKFENPLGRRFESEMPVLLLKHPTPAIMEAVQRVSAELIKFIKTREDEYDMHVLYQQNNIAIALGAFPNDKDLKPEEIIKILADNKPEDFIRIMYIHFKYAQCITRDAPVTTAPAREPVGKLREIVSELFNKPNEPEGESEKKERLIQFFTKGIQEPFWPGKGYRHHIADDVFYNSSLYTAERNRGRLGRIGYSTHDQLGLMLKGQEEHASGFPTEKGRWIPDCKEQEADLDSGYVLDLIENDAIYVAGPSGMTSLFLGQMEFLANLEDVNLKKNYLAAVVAYIVGGGFHSLHEVIGPAQYALDLVPGYNVAPPQKGKWAEAPNFKQFFDQQAQIDPDFAQRNNQAWGNYLNYFNDVYAPNHMPGYEPVQLPGQPVESELDNGKMEIKEEDIQPAVIGMDVENSDSEENQMNDESTPLLSQPKQENKVSPDLIKAIQNELKEYINSRANQKKDTYELNFISRHFRDKDLTHRKVDIAYQLITDLENVVDYPDLQEKISTAFLSNQKTEQEAGKTYGYLTKSGLGRCLNDIRALIHDDLHTQSNSMQAMNKK
ncbi:hypothetical protein GH742_01195 [Legionella sp. MW5194]|uniref:hypothetical protein n=1 Tax=Legionella sp. MW5194 TaxID=2662448 RepID=UPI00193D61D0|nr:hypothetical protein [Legionella sp. MW5194]QRN02599.1 hypothetical protein GH742_01195 [Legionella sp. MW5194]